jgi:hypothetical protein
MAQRLVEVGDGADDDFDFPQLNVCAQEDRRYLVGVNQLVAAQYDVLCLAILVGPR